MANILRILYDINGNNLAGGETMSEEPQKQKRSLYEIAFGPFLETFGAWLGNVGHKVFKNPVPDINSAPKIEAEVEKFAIEDQREREVARKFCSYIEHRRQKFAISTS
jgi:hypothetical protein